MTNICNCSGRTSSRERSLEHDRSSSRTRRPLEEGVTPRGQLKRTQSGRVVDRKEAVGKPRALSFRVSPVPPPGSLGGEQQQSSVRHQVHDDGSVYHASAVQQQQYHQPKAARLSEAGAGAGDRGSLPPPLPVRKGRGGQQRYSEPLMYPSMPSVELIGFDVQNPLEVDNQVLV